MPAKDAEYCGTTSFYLLPQIVHMFTFYSAVNSVPQASAQDEAAVTSWDTLSGAVANCDRCWVSSRVSCRVDRRYEAIVRHRCLQVINEESTGQIMLKLE